MPKKTIRKDGPEIKEEYMFNAIRYAMSEVGNAEAKHGTLPADLIHAASVVSMEAGEMLHASVNYTFQVPAPDLNNLIEETTQTAAMALRFLHDLLILKDKMK